MGKKMVDGDGGVKLIQRSAKNGDILLAGGFEHVAGDGAGGTGENGADADEGGDRDGVLVGLNGDQNGVFGGISHDIAEEIGGEGGCDFGVRGVQNALGVGNFQ